MASDRDLGVVVIGGCGYLGSNLVKALRTEATCSAIHVISRNPTQNLFPDVAYHSGDIPNPQQISSLFAEIKPRVAFHTASPKLNAPEELFRRTNIEGTRVLLKSATETASVRAFVFTGTDSAFEQLPGVKQTEEVAKLYTEKSHANPYAKTKAIADRDVQAANAPPALGTAVIRIPGVYGENDDNLVGTLLNTIKRGEHKIQIGDNKRPFEFLYMEKACEAHILAAKALLAADSKIGGEAFFVSDGVSLPFLDFARKLFAGAGHPVAKDQIKVVPVWLVLSFAYLAEWLYWIFTFNTKTPQVRSRAIKYLAGGCQWDITKAKERLGYKPVADQDVVLNKVVESEAKRLGR
jgi:sterol-4alpha-carboxylate 3-dehydrogenase (decarboxylating)